MRFVAAEWIADGAMTEAEAMSAWLAARYLYHLDHPDVDIGDDVDLIRARAAWKLALPE